jgi:hypothetical protein
MQGWLHYLQLKVQSKTGLSSDLVVWALIALPSGVIGLCFVIFAAFIWLAERIGSLYAALALAGVFLIVALIALAVAIASHRRTIREAELALAVQRRSPWLDPKLVRVGLQASRAIGPRKLVPVLAVGVLAAAFGMQWFGRAKTKEADIRRVTAHAG